MSIRDGVYLTLSELFTASEMGRANTLPLTSPRSHQLPTEQWQGAIAALTQFLQQTLTPTEDASIDWQGVCLSGPAPVLESPTLKDFFYQAIATAAAWQHHLPQLCADNASKPQPPGPLAQLPLFPQDPLSQEQFCLVKTANFSLLLVLGQDPQGHSAFFWSFDPEILKAAWLGLRSRWQYVFSPDLTFLEALMERFPWQEPDFRQVSHFSQYLIQQLVTAQPQTSPAVSNSVENTSHNHNGRNGHKPSLDPVEPSADVKLLQALTHEIRTPLTSIRTMTRLLLRRRDLSTDVSQRIEAIDRECQEQISRMELIFRATELESGTVPELVVPLMTTALDHVFESGIPRWQRQAQRYQVDLQVEMPQSLPQVWSNPHLLDQVLSGLIEKFVRSLSSGGVIRLHIGTAGEQLKVQFQTQSSHHLNPLKALGELLMFQPETGCLSLNWDVTKNLFQLLGGKLTVRRRSPSEEILTIFLPLGPVPKR